MVWQEDSDNVAWRNKITHSMPSRIINYPFNMLFTDLVSQANITTVLPQKIQNQPSHWYHREKAERRSFSMSIVYDTLLIILYDFSHDAFFALFSK